MPHGTDSRGALLAAALAAICAFLLAALAPDVGPWGDGLGIVQALEDPAVASPRVYHFGYRLAAQAAVAVGATLDLSVEAALIALSRLAIALGAAVAAWLAVSAGARLATAIGWTLLAIVSPSLLFFSGTVEVHAVQFLGSAIALLLAVRASHSAKPWRRFALVAAAAGVALTAHLSHLLLVPALVQVALPPGRLSRRERLGVVAVAGLAIGLAVLCWFVHAAAPNTAPGGVLTGAWYLGLYEKLFVEFRAEYGWFGPLEVATYLVREGLGQGGWMWAAPLVVFLGVRFEGGKRRVAVLLALLLVYLAVVPQSGLRERGGYFVSLFPWFVYLTAQIQVPGRHGRVLAVLPFVALPLQYALAHVDAAAYALRPDARAWARAVMARVEEPCFVFTSDMVQLSALPLTRGGNALQWTQQFDYTPRRSWDAKLRPAYEAALLDALGRGRVYLDADILGVEEDSRTEAQQWAIDLLARPSVELVAIAGDTGRGERTLLVEVRLTSPAGD